MATDPNPPALRMMTAEQWDEANSNARFGYEEMHLDRVLQEVMAQAAEVARLRAERAALRTWLREQRASLVAYIGQLDISENRRNEILPRIVILDAVAARLDAIPKE
jgi:hypothetical protein